ncbi:MAG: hypothetical protein ACK46X_04365 [Candidatus Sericytochromatia bacterium]
MRLGGIAAIAALLVGCVTTPASQPSPPVPSPSSGLAEPSPIASPDGLWLLGREGDPSPTPQVVESGSEQWWSSPGSSLVHLSLQGTTLRLTRHEFCGKPSEEAEGAWQGTTVRLDGTAFRSRSAMPLRYELVYDSATGRFRGSRNGEAVWLELRRFVRFRGPCSVSMTVRLFDDRGHPVRNRASVRIESLDPSNPLETELGVEGGEGAIGQVPSQVPLRLTVEAAGYQARTREVVVERGPEWPVHFGGPADPADPEGAGFALTPTNR